MERVMSLLANKFSEKSDTEVHLILTGIHRRVDYPLSESVILHRPAFTFKNTRRRIDSLRTMLFLRRKIKSIDPDTILSFGEMWNNMVLLSLLGLPYPVYISDRSQPEKDLGTLQNYLRRKLYPKAAGYIAQTGYAAEICRRRNWNSNIVVIGNPVRTIRKESGIGKENLVLFVGRLIPTKHVDQLIRIFAGIDVPGWHFEIVGGDAKYMTLSQDYQKLIKELDAEDKISLEGESKDVDRYYNRAKIFAFTSSSEGFPNVIGEALSAGLPVVAYDCVAGPSDMIEEGENGFLIPLFNQEEFKKNLQLLMNDEILREEFSSKSRVKVQEFEAGKIVDLFYNFITDTQNVEKVKVAANK